MSADECARCGWAWAMSTRTSGPDREPDEGDVMICPSCAFVMVATGVGYAARECAAAERVELTANPAVVERVRIILSRRELALAEGRYQRMRKRRG